MHFTGYEVPFADIESLDDPRDMRLGHLLGTADMIAQMADRCYLEKCRDRLYPEFVLGGMALPLRQRQPARCATPRASTCCARRRISSPTTRAKRLDGEFNRAYRYLEILFDGRNPYIEAIDRNLSSCARCCAARAGACCGANPPLFAASPDTHGHRARADARLLQASLAPD